MSTETLHLILPVNKKKEHRPVEQHTQQKASPCDPALMRTKMKSSLEAQYSNNSTAERLLNSYSIY